MTPPPTIVFDLDGTLADTAPDIAAALNHILREAGLPAISLTHVRPMIGEGGRKLIARGFAAEGVKLADDEVEPLFNRFLDYYGTHLTVGTSLFPGAQPALETLLAHGAHLAICTNKPESLSRALLAALGIDHMFSCLIGADTLAVRKPDPLTLTTAVARAGGTLDAAFMVGDSHTDIKTARAAGTPIIGVSFGYTPVPLSAADVDILIDHFDALKPALTRLGAALIER